MRVAFDVGPLKPNPAGVGVYVSSLARGFAEIGRNDLHYIGRRPDATGLPEHIPSEFRSPRVPYSAWVEVFGDRAARAAGADLAHYTDGLVPAVRRRPTAVTVLDMSLVRHWRAHRVLRYPRIPLVLAAPKLADEVLAISQATADVVVRLTRTPARKIHVVPLAPRLSAKPASEPEVVRARARYGIGDRPMLVVPGTIEPRKNHLRVLAAFERLVRAREVADDLLLVIAGQAGWKSARTVDAIEASPAKSRIRFLGYVPEGDLAALMTAAAAVVYASTYEGFGLPVLEAMACGAPVVTSNVSSMPEVAGDAGILVNPFDDRSIARGIVEALLADDRSRDRAFRHAARFTWAATARATAEVYDKLAR